MEIRFEIQINDLRDDPENELPWITMDTAEHLSTARVLARDIASTYPGHKVHIVKITTIVETIHDEEVNDEATHEGDSDQLGADGSGGNASTGRNTDARSDVSKPPLRGMQY
jgi:hypothetical protein